MPVRGLLYLRLAEPLSNAALDALRTRFVAELGLDPDNDLMAPWVPLELAAYPEFLPGSPAHWYEANLAASYYGPGDERGHLPLFLRCAEWLERVPGGTVWYGDDESDESIHPFGPGARAELLAHYQRVGNEPFLRKHRRPGGPRRRSRPHGATVAGEIGVRQTEGHRVESPHEVFRQTLTATGNYVTALRTIRERFGLDLRQAKEVMLQAQGTATSLDEHEERIAEALIREFNPHCCEDMLREAMRVCDKHPNRSDCPDCLIHYSPRFREYGLIIHDGGTASSRVAFCPWCGTRLPESLRDKWFAEMERRGIDPQKGEVPAEFQSAAWWQQRHTQQKPVGS